MSYSQDQTFFFAGYGCCVGTEAYMWIIVTLFIFTMFVIMFCMFSTATTRWIYKRRMRKQLQDLKQKYARDQRIKREYESKLVNLAKKTIKSSGKKDPKSSKTPFDISVDPAKEYSTKKMRENKMRQATPFRKYVSVEDATPMALSSIASEMNVQQAAESPEVPVEVPVVPKRPPLLLSAHRKNPTARDTSTPKVYGQPEMAATPVAPPNDSPTKHREIPSPTPTPTLTPNQKIEASLAPPTTAPSLSSNPEFRDFDVTNASNPPSKVATPLVRNNSSIGITPRNAMPSSMIPNQNKKDTLSTNTSLSSEKKENLVYTSDNIVSSRYDENEKNDKIKNHRKEGGGGKKERKYFDLKSKKTKSSFPGSSSWLFDSTGSRRDDDIEQGIPNQTSTSKTNSLWKTDSSLYKTASFENYPHGAFKFTS